MKKTLLILVSSCLSLFGQAAATDYESLDNTLYIDPFTVKVSEQIDVSVKMKNTATISAFVCEIFLPEGMSFVLQENGKPECQLHAERVPEGMFGMESEVLENRGAKFQTFIRDNTTDPYFLKTDGEIMTFRVAVDKNMPIGECTIELKNMELTNHSTGQRAGDLRKVVLETTVTVAPSFHELNENSTTAPKAASDVNVVVRRTIKAGQWSTICLPFAMTEAQCKAAFGNDVQLADFTGAVANDGNISVNFSNVSAMEANHPYIIKVGSNISEFSLEGVDIVPTENPRVDKDKERRFYNSFIGTYVAETLIPDYSLFLNDNQFWFSKGNTKIKAFRAYFTLDTAGADYNAASKDIVMVFEDVTTGIKRHEALNAEGEEQWYNLAGQRVAVPEKGLYIKNGKKIVK